MSSTTLVGSLVVLLSLLVVDIFCADLTNVKQSNLPHPGDNTQQKSTTPWPSLKDRWTVKPRPQNDLRRPPVGTAKGWIQQNNIWIRNEQAVAQEQNNQIVPKSTTPKNFLTNLNVPNFSDRTTKNTQNEQNQNIRGQNVPNRGQNTHQMISNKNHQDFPALNTPKSTSTEKNGQPTLSREKSWVEIVNGGTIILSTTPKNVSPLPSKGSNNQTPEPSENSFGNQDIDNLQVSDSPVTDDELREFSETLLKRDTNNAAKYVTVNLQSMTSSRSQEDKAPEPLLEIDQQAYKIPSIEKMIRLHDNYFLDASINEARSGAERIEENELLDAMINTPVMQYARTFLMQKGKIGKDPKEFRELLKLIWFNMYSRGHGRIGSSGFEHVFVAELKNNQVSGLHNWLYFNEEEKNQRANYLGYMKKIDLGNKGSILKYHFTFHGVDKPVGSMFIGTSPELEFALYSTCFLLRADRICPLKMNDNRFIIRTYTFRYGGKNLIGSAFPEI